MIPKVCFSASPFKKLSNKTMVEEYNKKDSIIKYGPYLYIGIAVISVFFS